MTYEGSCDVGALARLAREPAILITDDAAVATRCASLASAAQWIGRILIVRGRTASRIRDNVEIVDNGTAARDIRLTLDRWRERRLH